MLIADSKHKELVVEILVSAFEDYKDDNSINFVVKQDNKRVKRMRILMEYLFEKAITTGAVYLSDDKKCCLLLDYPLSNKHSFNTIWQTIKLVMSCIGIGRIGVVLRRQQVMKKYEPKEDFVKPLIIGIKKENKGSFTAGGLMLAVMEKYKDQKMPVIIDTVSKYNLRLYQKLGFKLVNKDESLGYPMYLLRLN